MIYNTPAIGVMIKQKVRKKKRAVHLSTLCVNMEKFFK